MAMSDMTTIRSLGRLSLGAAATLLLASCVSAVLDSRGDPRESGLKYYLPKTLVSIEIVPVGYPPAAKIVELGESERNAAIEVGNVRVQARIAGRRYTVLVDKDGGLAEPLITGLQLQLAAGKPERNVPDTRAGMVLQYQPSVTSSDRVCMGVDADNLLKFVEAKVKDETGNILVSIAKVVGRLAGPGAFSTTAPAQQLLNNMIVPLQIDPLDQWDRQSVVDAINANFPSLRGQYGFTADDAAYFLPRHVKAESEVCPENHICYRTRGPMRLSLSNQTTGGKSIAYAQVVNRSVTHKIDVTRAFLIEKVTLLRFEGGILEDVKIRKPSEALEAAKLPLTLYDAIVTSLLAAPGRAISGVTNPPSMEQALTDYKNSVMKVDAIRRDLNAIRDGDLTQATEDDPKTFELKCTG
ncbi:MAG: hypothetical protein JWR80_2320 [Bradyrhizobium sp.]|nr:hypothetical protein [Bradyrhizobium sp.]